MRNFHEDFCGPAMRGLSEDQAVRVAIALDTAIMFGVLEYLDGNESITRLSRDEIEKLYQRRCERLKT